MYWCYLISSCCHYTEARGLFILALLLKLNFWCVGDHGGVSLLRCCGDLNEKSSRVHFPVGPRGLREHLNKRQNLTDSAINSVIAFLLQLALLLSPCVGLGTFLCRIISEIGLNRQHECEFIEGRILKPCFISRGTVPSGTDEWYPKPALPCCNDLHAEAGWQDGNLHSAGSGLGTFPHLAHAALQTTVLWAGCGSSSLPVRRGCIISS